MTGRLELENGDSIPLDVASVLPGDFIRSELDPRIVGWVESRGFLAKQPAFKIRNTHNRLLIIFESDAVILGLGRLADELRDTE